VKKGQFSKRVNRRTMQHSNAYQTRCSSRIDTRSRDRPLTPLWITNAP
jgi:hypothetical protein